MRIAALVLAAGQSTRMGAGNKLLALIEGKPVLVHVVDALLGSLVDDVVVVTGHDDAGVREALRDRMVHYRLNPDFRLGMGASIAAGLSALEGIEADRPENARADAVLICLGDMPAISSTTIEVVLASFESSAQPGAIVMPTFEGRRGHPVLFAASYFDALRRLTGDVGAREIISSAGARVIEVPCDDAGIHQDIDSPADLDSMRARTQQPS